MSGIINSTGARSGVIGTTVGTPAGGISDYDEWHSDTDISSPTSDTTITSWTHNTTHGPIGSAMTRSSGIFMFPSTGYWRITTHARWASTGTGYSRYNLLYCNWASAIGGPYTYLSFTDAGMASDVTNSYSTSTTSAVLKVTDESTFEVYFLVNSQSGHTFKGTQVESFPTATFMKIAGL